MTAPSELDRLLAAELSRRVTLLGAEADTREIRAALHSLKGSAALAGYLDLALVISQLGARLHSEPEQTRVEAQAILEAARERLEQGLPPFSTQFPEPPPGLRPSVLERRYLGDYLAAVRERLAQLDELCASELDPRQALTQAYRVVHSMKGSAGAVGDDVMAWYCHGLETRIASSMRSETAIGDALRELGRHRGVLASLIEQPEQALDALRAFGEVRRMDPLRRHSERPPSPSQPPPADEASHPLLRVSPALVERLSEQVERLGIVQRELSSTSELGQQLAARLRELGAELLEAQRLIGPSRPWGVPAAALLRIETSARALRASAALSDRGAALCRRHAEVLRSHTNEFNQELSGLRRTTVGWLFERVGRAVERLSQRENGVVQIETTGVELPIDRVTAERLVDPVLQLARNAFAHGIESPNERSREGKPPFGKISMCAERSGEWLRVVVEDDGRGVDVERIRSLALYHGLLSPEAALSADENELLALLFVPGFTTQPEADVLAGRGVGLELAQQVVSRLGGAIRLRSRPNAGLLAIVEIPVATGPVDVLWIQAAGFSFALPVGHAGRVGIPGPEPPVSLARCLDLGRVARPRLELELRIVGVHPIQFGIDAVGDIERVSIRPIPELIAARGPFAGAVLRADGSLALVLDAALLAARAWTEAQLLPHATR